MKPQEIEALYLTRAEAAEYLDVNPFRIYSLRDAGRITELKGGVYDRASVEAYKDKRGDRKGGRYPK
jgi:hypothetical protein